MNINRRTYQNRPLSNEEINSLAPSAFATTPWYAQSERYAFVPTSNVIEGMRKAGFMPYSVMQARTRIADKQFFTKHVIRFRPENSALTQVGDTAVEAVMTNSHDGTSAYEIALGAFRLACLNGLMVSEGLAQIIKIRHTGNIIDAVVSGTAQILESAPKVVEAISLWKSIILNEAEQMFLAEGAHSLRFENGSPLEPAKLLNARRYNDNASDLWTVFNRIQENVISGGLRTVNPSFVDGEGQYHPTRRNRTRAVTGIAESTKLNRALWTLAEKMAAIKVAA